MGSRDKMLGVVGGMSDGFIRPQHPGTLTRVIRWLLVSISAARTLFFLAAGNHCLVTC